MNVHPKDNQLFDSMLSMIHPLCSEIVWSLVEQRPGLYLITRQRSVIYVGRSDTDIRRRLLYHCGRSEFRGLNFTFIYARSPIAAYRFECRAIHHFSKLESLMNRINAALPNNMTS
jgi:predicted GIY-YIG superfamily endonuclease